jgi:sulfotransferase family protein
MQRRVLSENLIAGFDPIVVILSPPRCGSTVLARSFWQHRAFRWYLHEPCDRAYHIGPSPQPQPQPSADMLVDRIGLFRQNREGTGLVIKEMTFQAGDVIEEFRVATTPVIFLIRDPRLSVLSRMDRRERDGDSASFPAREAGWRDLIAATALFRAAGTPYVIVDISDIRRKPGVALRALCHRLGLPWDPAMLRWKSLSGLRLGNIGGRQDAWYDRVLSSTAWEQPDEDLPSPEVFHEHEMGDVVAECLAAYRHVRTDPHYLGIDASPLMSMTEWDL